MPFTTVINKRPWSIILKRVHFQWFSSFSSSASSDFREKSLCFSGESPHIFLFILRHRYLFTKRGIEKITFSIFRLDSFFWYFLTLWWNYPLVIWKDDSRKRRIFAKKIWKWKKNELWKTKLKKSREKNCR